MLAERWVTGVRYPFEGNLLTRGGVSVVKGGFAPRFARRPGAALWAAFLSIFRKMKRVG